MGKKEVKRYIIIAAIAAAAFILVQNFSVAVKLFTMLLRALQPLILGGIMAYIFNIIMSSFEKRYFPSRKTGFINSTRRPVCLIMSFVITAAVIALILNIIIPEIVSAVKLMGNFIPDFVADCKEFILKKLEEYPKIQEEIKSFKIDKSEFTVTLTNGALGVFNSALMIIGTVTSTVTNTVIGLIFAIYLLARKDKLHKDINRLQNAYFNEKLNKQVNHICATAHECFTKFFIGQFIEAILLGTLTFIGSLILRLPYPAMTGTIVGVTALVPIIGAFLGAGIGALIIFTVNPVQSLIFIIFIIILQQLDNNIFYPKIVGSSVGLPGIWVLAAVTVGGSLCGVMGMLIGVPLAATIYKLYYEHLEIKEKEMGINTTASEESPGVTAKKKRDKPKKQKK